MDEKTLHILEYPKVLEKLAAYCAFASGGYQVEPYALVEIRDQAGQVRKPRFERLRMLRGRAPAAANDGAYHYRAGNLAARHVAPLGGVVHDLVQAHRQEIHAHVDEDGAHAAHRGTGGYAGQGVSNFVRDRRRDPPEHGEPRHQSRG